jgi:hypothetical protein
VAGEAAVAESPDPTPVACEIVSLQFRCLTTTSCDRGCIDSQVVDPPMVALGLQTTGVEESFKAKPLTPLPWWHV